MKTVGWTPVAEYRGVAILEQGGDQRTVWQGREYLTDGKTYIWILKGEDVVTIGMPDELACKEFIDLLRDQPALLDQVNPSYVGIFGGPPSSLRYASWSEAWGLLNKPWTGPVPEFRWDEAGGHFVATHWTRPLKWADPFGE
jgi:hypothetical protein